MPAYERFHSGVPGKPQLGVQIGGIGVSVFSALPEFAAVASLEGHHIFCDW